MLDPLKHLPLVVCMLYLLHLDNLSFLQYLDSIEPLIVLGLDQMHSTKGTSTQRSFHLEVCQGIFALGLAGRRFTLDRPTSRINEVSDIHVFFLGGAVARGVYIGRTGGRGYCGGGSCGGLGLGIGVGGTCLRRDR